MGSTLKWLFSFSVHFLMRLGPLAIHAIWALAFSPPSALIGGVLRLALLVVLGFALIGTLVSWLGDLLSVALFLLPIMGLVGFGTALVFGVFKARRLA